MAISSFPKFLEASLIFFFLLFITTTAKPRPSSRTIGPTTLGKFNKQEKLSHLHFYFHDIIGGRNQTAVRVAAAPSTNTSPTGFGAVVMMDDPLTETREPGSKIVGRAQGMYASASQSELGFLMVLNFVFTEGKYNGSSISVMGRNTVESAVRRCPSWVAVGCSGSLVATLRHGLILLMCSKPLWSMMCMYSIIKDGKFFPATWSKPFYPPT